MIPPAHSDLPGSSDMGRSAVPGAYPSSETVWSSRTQWGAILVGSMAGIVALVLMGTLGAALGITAGAIGVASIQTVNVDTAGKAASMITIGTALWFLLTALVSGLAGGWALNATARRDRPYSSLIFGAVSWGVGLCVLLAVAAPALGGTVSGMGSTAAAVLTGQPEAIPRMTREAVPPGARSEAGKPLTDEEKGLAKDAAEKATAAASGAAWVLLGSQLISIAATIFAAGWSRHTGARVVTEVRPRPATMS